MRKYNAMADHWLTYGPPVYISVAGYLGLTKPGKKTKPKPESSNLDELVAMLSDTGGVL